jgi:hypothetical protein
MTGGRVGAVSLGVVQSVRRGAGDGRSMEMGAGDERATRGAGDGRSMEVGAGDGRGRRGEERGATPQDTVVDEDTGPGALGVVRVQEPDSPPLHVPQHPGQGAYRCRGKDRKRGCEEVISTSAHPDLRLRGF